MRVTRAATAAMVLVGLFSVGVWVAGPALAAGDAVGTSFSLDEYSLMSSRAPDDWQLAAGVTLGDSIRDGYYLFGGGRLSWVKTIDGSRTSNGWALGGVGGVGFRPSAVFSPVASVAVDKLFGMTDSYNLKLTASAGVRVRVVKQLDPHYAITFQLFRSTLYGESGVADRSDFGLAVVYAVGFFGRR